MAKSKQDIKYGTAQAKLSEDETLRVNYKHGTPLEGGKIADSEPVDVFSSAHNISKTKSSSDDSASESAAQAQQQRDPKAGSNTNNSNNTTKA